MTKTRITFIGGGNLTLAILSSLKSEVHKYDIRVIDNNNNRKKDIKKFKVRFSNELDNQINESAIIFLVTKPQNYTSVLAKLKSLITAKTTLASFMAGVRIKDIQKELSMKNTIIRLMTNISISNNNSLIFYYINNRKYDVRKFSTIFTRQNAVIRCKSESELDKFTALYGSAPAYYLYFNEMMKNIYKKFGYSNKDAKLLSNNLFIETARLLDSYKNNKDLIKMVASKGGTTEAALKYLSKSRFTIDLQKAVNEAVNKSKNITKIK